MKIIFRGAESILYISNVGGKRVLVKERLKKGYRIKELDESIRSQRTRREYKLMLKAKEAGINIPEIVSVDEFKINMEYIDGQRLKDVLNNLDKKTRLMVCENIGNIISKLHNSDIIHGDLTTSNLILKENKLYLIDFGLGKISGKIEDKAVDLFLLYEALKSTHFKILDECWQNILRIYAQNYSKAKEVLDRVEIIKRRRRYK
jgi:TP53 regulating kinase-like protein